MVSFFFRSPFRLSNKLCLSLKHALFICSCKEVNILVIREMWLFLLVIKMFYETVFHAVSFWVFKAWMSLAIGKKGIPSDRFSYASYGASESVQISCKCFYFRNLLVSVEIILDRHDWASKRFWQITKSKINFILFWIERNTVHLFIRLYSRVACDGDNRGRYKVRLPANLVTVILYSSNSCS